MPDYAVPTDPREQHEMVEVAMCRTGLRSDYFRMTVWGIYERCGCAAALEYIAAWERKRQAREDDENAND